MSAKANAWVLFAISALSLALEIVYTRVCSVVYSPFFVYKVIGLALLGLGAGSILVRISFGWISTRPVQRMLDAVLVFGVTALVPLAVLQRFQETFIFHAFLSLCLALPFVAAGAAVSIAYACSGEARHQYTWNLLGSVAGVAMYSFAQETLGAIGLMVALAGLAVLLVAVQPGLTLGRRVVAVTTLGLCLACARPATRMVLPSQGYKWFTLFQSIPTFLHEFSHWDPVAKIDVFSFAPPMGTADEPIPVKILTQDYSAPSIYQRFQDVEAIRHSRFLDTEIRGAAYWIRPAPSKVLVIGVGGGPDVQTAVHFGAKSITAVEINPTTLSLVKGRYNDFLGGIGRLPEITYVNEDGGRFLRQAGTRYDVIQLSGVDTDVASLGGTSRIAENYLYTVEAFRSIYERLEDDGVAFLLWADFGAFLPVRERMYTTALVALRELGVREPWRQLMVATGEGSFIILIKKGGVFSPAEVDTVRTRFANVLKMEVTLVFRLFPDLQRATSQERGLLFPGTVGEEPAFFAQANAEVLSARPNWKGLSQRFNLAPTTNDIPFFFIVDRWDGEITNFRHVIINLVRLLGLAAALLLVPLLTLRRERMPYGVAVRALAVPAFFFFAVGLAFMVVEVVLLQRFVLLIGRPTFSVPLVLTGLLCAMTVGNALAQRLAARPSRVLLVAGGLLLAVLSVYSPLLDRLFVVCDGLPMAPRLLAAAVMIVPVGLLMGVPFPLGLAVMEAAQERASIPWLLAANAAANTIGAILALLLGWNLGLSGSLRIAGCVYLVGCAALSWHLSARGAGTGETSTAAA